MTIDEVWALRTGDEIFWNDPDDGLCSRVYLIREIKVDGDVVTIVDVDGSVLECFVSELS